MDPERLDHICLQKPGTTQDIKWETNLCYLIGEKIYCVTGTEPPFYASFRVQPEEFAELTERPGIKPAPYLARNHWISIDNAFALDKEEWDRYLEQAYQLTLAKLSKKKQRELTGEA